MTASLADSRTPFDFDNSYARLPERFFARLPPTPVAGPALIKVNTALAAELGLDLASLTQSQQAAIFAGNVVPPGAEPIAQAYAGHQFANFVPQLGDGRAILLGEVVDRAGQRRDIQLKGAGPTPFSRRGDGRAALGPVLREYIVSEAMHALGIPTTRALAAVTTGEPVYREGALPGAVFTRVAASHIRVGTFQYFAVRDDLAGVKALADHVIARHYPQLQGAAQPYLALLDAVVERQAMLVAGWLHVGFIHGVMNTDNMTVSGETIDFGPCAFMDAYDPATVFSSIDRTGRYAYANQPGIAQWNLARLAETLLGLIDADTDQAIALATEVIRAFPDRFQAHWLAGMRRKLGLFTQEAGDLALAQALLAAMHGNGADFTLTFRGLCRAALGDAAVRGRFAAPEAFDQWASMWQARLARESQAAAERAAWMRGANPAFIARNHRVEQALDAATTRRDFSLFEDLMRVLARPYDDQDDAAPYAEPPQPDERVLATFCGT
ncbi:YdiU family protein [Oleomonas cavernae]|uniref:Protein nucleotidyltransferase YdiU n=1 Tax=Oleomonas cavernae TaxID=2320859 RepID=A0A418VTR6_9PROT|nr:YdiU family protein [Oleomonas cavernae]RJF80541.1 YdiU family protein [Oleomonas cavernae]